MYVHSNRLPQLLEPSAYYAPEAYAREVERLFLPGWQLVGTTADLASPGAFLTLELFGRPVQVRNFDGEIVALANVCAHRHAIITSAEHGCSATMHCQYHGWEYGSDGCTRRIPDAKQFAPVEREAFRLPRYRLATAGQLVFVSLADAGPSLEEYLGDYYALCAERFGADCRQSLSWNPSNPVNWKIPIENALEAYHVPNVHPRTFKRDPGEERSEHRLRERDTAFGTQLPFCPHSTVDRWFQACEGRFVRLMGQEPTADYWQHHRFPNLLFSFTDTLSLVQAILPTGPTSSVAIVRQFGRFAAAKGAWRRMLAGGWGRLAAAITRQVLAEDMQLFPAIQRGLQASPHRGVLGRCEERIHAFQAWVEANAK
jgi:phenylpropionate dioxygenase-like ring-hydroxylating dioxygenase large terminal subunit